MSIVTSYNSDEGEIELTNGWVIHTGTQEDSEVQNTVIEIYEPNGDRYDRSQVLLNAESANDVVDIFVEKTEQFDDVSDLSRLKQTNSQVIREIARVLPNF